MPRIQPPNPFEGFEVTYWNRPSCRGYLPIRLLQVLSEIQDGDAHLALSGAGEQATEIETAFKAGEVKASANLTEHFIL